MINKLPNGIENYKDIALDCYYVIKTLLIKGIIDTPIGTAVLFTRPRRFGKSLALALLEDFPVFFLVEILHQGRKEHVTKDGEEEVDEIGPRERGQAQGRVGI